MRTLWNMKLKTPWIENISSKGSASWLYIELLDDLSQLIG